MKKPRRIPSVVTLTVGLALGWGLSHQRMPSVKAGGGGGDRSGDYSLTSGPIAVEFNERTKTQASQDALYFLDYRAAKLVATIPVQKSSAAGSQMIGQFVERDLIADFKVDAERGASPHFLMTPGSLGAYAEGWAPLFVYETTTRQLAVYKLQVQSIGTRSSSKFELLEIKSYAAPTASPARAN